MGIIISKADFTGKYLVQQNSYDVLDDIINDNEKELLVKLLGLDLFNLFQADLNNGVPQSQIYLDIFNELYYTHGDCEMVSRGMKDYVLGQIYLLYLRDASLKNPTGGAVRLNQEVAQGAEGQGYLPAIKYNNSIETGEAIQWYIHLNSSSYPDFNGQPLQYISII